MQLVSAEKRSVGVSLAAAEKFPIAPLFSALFQK